MNTKPEITAGSVLITQAQSIHTFEQIEVQILVEAIGVYSTLMAHADYLANRYPSLGLTALETKAGAEILKRKTEQLKEYLIAAQQ